MKRALALFALAGLALTGCSATTTPAPAAAPTTSDAPASSAPATASVADYIAGTTTTRRQLQEWIDDFEESSCRAGEVETNLLCSMKMMTAEMEANMAGMALEGMNSTKATYYVGPPPVELAARVKKSIGAAKDIQDSAKKIVDKDCHPTLGCGTYFWDVTQGMQGLLDELNSWEAYK
ncbi:hypothetical protein GCM10009715_39810 [Paeniglutamicibacter psychrophenolicus]|uniref:ABC-type phosphate transport system substrate-binding protein n=1 Tax=Paeniglutamicibacter psychrophenolicus TaxID=257454 RepID=A0ABS4WBB2_9MICC|nr:hypothetical protein [Paeniglutamicibacter psychrophenolicus]MBP2373331.1 ABC-type phosphate transport system substrate-binding protein [Paeniglutamicibacter psychrophenolicus]